jgi:hypothetical protein
MSGDEGNISNQGDLLTVLKSNGATQTGAFAALVATIVQPFAQDSMIEALNLCDSFAIYLEIAFQLEKLWVTSGSGSFPSV